MKWQPIESAPRDGTNILLFTTCHGIVEAWYAPGGWEPDYFAPNGKDYYGACWVCADDAFEIEVEETDPPHDGTATHWMPLPDPPEGQT